LEGINGPRYCHNLQIIILVISRFSDVLNLERNVAVGGLGAHSNRNLGFSASDHHLPQSRKLKGFDGSLKIQRRDVITE